MKKLLNYTWVGWLNIIVLQWLFVRLFYVENDNSAAENWGVIFPIIPLTGWWSNYLPSKYWNIKI